MKHYTETEIRYCFDDDKQQLSSEREIKSFSPVITSESSPASGASKTNTSSTKRVTKLTTTTTTKSTTTLSAAGTEDDSDNKKIRERKEEISSGVTTVISSSTDIEGKYDDFTPASTTVGDDNKIEEEASVTSDETENVLKYSSTDSFSISGDQGTTPR